MKFFKFQNVCSLICISILVCLFSFSVNTFAGSKDIVFTTCDCYGNIRPTDVQITESMITISNLDTSGNYIYYGADIGVFEVSDTGENVTSIFTKRVVTNDLNIQVTDFGDISKYDENKVYILGSRVLYQCVGNNGIIVEDKWQMQSDAYFKLSSNYIKYIFMTCARDGTIRSTDKPVMESMVEISNLDISGNYIYYGADIGTFEVPSVGEDWNSIFAKRVATNNLNIQVTGFGDISKYSENKVYSLGSRVLYQCVGNNVSIIEDKWQVQPDSYFRKVACIYGFTTCARDGTIRSTDKSVTRSMVEISNLDTSGNYTYYGADIGVFDVPSVGEDLNSIFTKRVVTNDLNVQTSDLGDISKYREGKVYTLGSRALYKCTGINGSIIEDKWQIQPDTYFKISLYLIRYAFITCAKDGTIRPTDKIFTTSAVNISDLDTSGNYVYYGADIGVFKVSQTDENWPSIITKRVVGNNLNILVDDFGDINKYKLNQVYLFNSRALYQFIGNNGAIAEDAWKKDADSYFKVILITDGIEHKQVVNYQYNFEQKSIEVSEPNGSKLTGAELDAFNNAYIFIDGDVLTYRLRFNASNTNIADIELELNSPPSDQEVQLELFKADINGTAIDIENAMKSPNNYTLNINNANSLGTNCLEYKVRLKIDANTDSDSYATIINKAKITFKDSSGNIIGYTLAPDVKTKIYKGRIIVR